MITIPQRLRAVAVRLRKPRDGRPWGADDGAADLLDAIAAELEAPATDAAPVVAWLYREFGPHAGKDEFHRSAAETERVCKKFGGTSEPLVYHRDHLATVAALQSRIKSLEDENFSLAAGQCVIPGGLCGDEGGSQYCSLQRAASNAKTPP